MVKMVHTAHAEHSADGFFSRSLQVQHVVFLTFKLRGALRKTLMKYERVKIMDLWTHRCFFHFLFSMNSRLVFATSNLNKLREVQQILGSSVKNIENRKLDRKFLLCALRQFAEFYIQFRNCRENPNTYRHKSANSLCKMFAALS